MNELEPIKRFELLSNSFHTCFLTLPLNLVSSSSCEVQINLFSLGFILTWLLIFFNKKYKLSFGGKCFLLFDFFVCLSRSLVNGRFYWPTNVVLFTLLSDLSWKQFFIHKPINFEQYSNFRKFSISSFGRKLSQNCG